MDNDIRDVDSFPIYSPFTQTMSDFVIRTYCRTEENRVDKQGLSSIFFIVNLADLGNIKVPTKEKCLSSAWSQDGQCVKDIKRQPDAADINTRLKLKKEKLHLLLRTNPPAKARERFKDYLKEFERATVESASVLTFDEIIENLIREYKNEWSEGYKKRFRTIKTKFLEYDPDFTIDKMSALWWREYVNYCVDKLGNTNNTISTDAKVIQRLIQELNKKGHKLPPDFEEITWRYIEPEIMSITWDNVARIATVDLSDPIRSTMQDSRTAWLVGAYTGRRWSEIERMSEKNFYKDAKGRWRYKSTAKGLKPVDIPLLPEAVEFLKRIKFTIPKITQQTVNRDIKDIARIAGLKDEVLETTIKGKEAIETVVPEWKTIHIHTGRHSYAMHIVDLSAGQPHSEKFVSFMLGHASHATTWKYLNRRASSHDKMFDELIISKDKNPVSILKRLE